MAQRSWVLVLSTAESSGVTGDRPLYFLIAKSPVDGFGAEGTCWGMNRQHETCAELQWGMGGGAWEGCRQVPGKWAQAEEDPLQAV